MIMLFALFIGLTESISSMEKKPEHVTKEYNANNIIKPEKDMRKIRDMPEDIRKYYGITLTDNNKNNYIDINSGCYFRVISKNNSNENIM